MTMDWRAQAVCRDVDPEVFFPVAESGPARVEQVARAVAVCSRCPVRTQCLAWAVDALPYGVAGGLDEGQRRELRGSRTGARTA